MNRAGQEGKKEEEKVVDEQSAVQKLLRRTNVDKRRQTDTPAQENSAA